MRRWNRRIKTRKQETKNLKFKGVILVIFGTTYIIKLAGKTFFVDIIKYCKGADQTHCFRQ